MLGKHLKLETEAPIAVFDSGVGGISVLRALVKLMPEENYLYYGDSANAPYGIKTLEEVQALTVSHVDMFLKEGAKAVVVACNTATSAAIDIVRERYSKVPIIGIEPALKPAVLSKQCPTVVVMATPMTLREEKFHKLMCCYEKQAKIIPLPCPGLVEYVERGDMESLELERFLQELFMPWQADRIDAVVLGCTHYPFLGNSLRKVLGENISLYEGGPGTARETKRRLDQAGILNTSAGIGRIIFKSSEGTDEKDRLCRHLLSLNINE